MVLGLLELLPDTERKIRTISHGHAGPTAAVNLILHATKILIPRPARLHPNGELWAL